MFREGRNSYPRFFISPKVEIRDSPIHGGGVFAKEKLAPGEIIEACPIILFHFRDTMGALSGDDMVFGGQGGGIRRTQSRHVLMDYPFSWRNGMAAFALGWGGIYNHSTENPNAMWQRNFENLSLDFYTRRAVEPDEEICTRYVGYDMCEDLWFPESND